MRSNILLSTILALFTVSALAAPVQVGTQLSERAFGNQKAKGGAAAAVSCPFTDLEHYSCCLHDRRKARLTRRRKPRSSLPSRNSRRRSRQCVISVVNLVQLYTDKLYHSLKPLKLPRLPLPVTQVYVKYRSLPFDVY